MWKFLELVWTVRDSVWTVWAACSVIYAINCVLVCMRPEMAMEFWFRKEEPILDEWAAHG